MECHPRTALTRLTDFVQLHVAADSVGIEQADDTRLDFGQELLAALVILRHSDAFRTRRLIDKDQRTRNEKATSQSVLAGHV